MIILSISGMLPLTKLFGKLPDRNHLHCVQTTKGYNILNHDKSEELYHVMSKTATTRGKYRIREVKDAIAVGTISREQIQNEYIMFDSQDLEIGKIKIKRGKDIELVSSGNTYTASDIGRAKRFDFLDNDKKYVISIDKKILSLKDEYHIMFMDEINNVVAIMVAIAIDDYFHQGIK